MSGLNRQDAVVQLVEKSRILVALGAGGVGKTTSSIALAVIGAMLGKKVGLLSIDPAKRLADALGIELGSELKKIDLSKSGQLSGEIYGAMLDQKAVFDEMVERFTASAEIRTKIYKNSIYKEVSENLGGPLEYMALAKLQKMAEDQSFDLIVLDTPPDTHALDFLMRPNVLAGFMEKRVMTWLIKPFHLAQKLGAGKLLRAGGRLMSGISNVTGVKMLQMLSEFLVLMEDVIKGFNLAGQKVSELLRQDSTKFVLVAAPHNAAFRSAENLMQELHKNNYPLGALLINRCFPANMLEARSQLEQNWDMVHEYRSGLAVIANAMDHSQLLIEQLCNDTSKLFATAPVMVRVEERTQMIHSLASLLDFSLEVAGSAQIKPATT